MAFTLVEISRSCNGLRFRSVHCVNLQLMEKQLFGILDITVRRCIRYRWCIYRYRCARKGETYSKERRIHKERGEETDKRREGEGKNGKRRGMDEREFGKKDR